MAQQRQNSQVGEVRECAEYLGEGVVFDRIEVARAAARFFLLADNRRPILAGRRAATRLNRAAASSSAIGQPFQTSSAGDVTEQSRFALAIMIDGVTDFVPTC